MGALSTQETGLICPVAIDNHSMPWKISDEISAAASGGGGGGGNYWGPSKIKSGSKARIHALAVEPTCYFSVWAESSEGKSRCFRFTQQPTSEEIEQEMGSDYRRKQSNGKPDPLKPAIAFPIYNYETGEIQLCEILQKSLIKAFDEVANMEEYEDFDSIDFNISKEGAGLDTRYTLTPVPVKASSRDKIAEAWAVATKTISMEKYVLGEQPFTKA